MSGGNAYKRKSHRRIEVITSVAAVVVLYVILESFGVTCPIKYITGISCAGCGMSRAWISLLHFNIHDAFMYHPLFFLPPVVVIAMLFKSKINIKFYKIFMFTIAGAFVIVYLYRMFIGDGNVVVFEPQNNILFRIIQKLNLCGRELICFVQNVENRFRIQQSSAHIVEQIVHQSRILLVRQVRYSIRLRKS